MTNVHHFTGARHWLAVSCVKENGVIPFNVLRNISGFLGATGKQNV
jgi:hypothetical protein